MFFVLNSIFILYNFLMRIFWVLFVIDIELSFVFNFLFVEDVYVCGKCREEFLGFEEFLVYKKVCGSKVVLLYEGKDSENVESNKVDDFEDLNFFVKIFRYFDFEDQYNCGGLDGEGILDFMDNFDDDENEVMDVEDQQIVDEEIDEDLMKIFMMNVVVVVVNQDILVDSEEDEENNNIIDSKDEEKCLDDSKEKIIRNFQEFFMFLFLQFLLINLNVILELMNVIRVVVVQFVENNLVLVEIVLLYFIFYNLQQQ